MTSWKFDIFQKKRKKAINSIKISFKNWDQLMTSLMQKKCKSDADQDNKMATSN